MLSEATVRALVGVAGRAAVARLDSILTNDIEAVVAFRRTADPTTIRALAADWLAMRAELQSERQAFDEVENHYAALLGLTRDLRPAFVCDATCLWCSEGDACPTKDALDRLDAVLTGGRE